MNLKNIFGSNKKEPQTEYFLAVEIHESLIKSVCWEIIDGEPEIVQLGSFEAWEDEESLINGVDASISEAVKNLNSQPRRVILGLPESWFDDKGIHPTKKALIKKLLDNLDLTAIGVVSTTQAITHYLKKKEGIPPTAILLEIFHSKIVVSVITLGKVEATEEVGVSGDVARDVEEGLTRMEFDRLPARFILTDGSTLEEEQQQLVSYPWQEKLPFIHMPKVEVLPIDFSIRAVALTGGTEAASLLGVAVKEDALETTPVEESNLTLPEEPTPTSLEKLGFTYEETNPPEEISETVKAVDAVESQSSQQPKISNLAQELDNQKEAEYAVSPEEVRQAGNRPKISFAPLAFVNNLKNKFSKPSRTGNKNNLRFLLIPLLLLIIVAGAFGFYFFLGSAQITVKITPKKLDQQFNIAIAEQAQPGTPTLIATKKTIPASDKETVNTTGEATVGDKAQGTVTIANRTIAPLVLKSGTIITVDNSKLAFVLQDSVTIASKSADPLTFQETYGKATNVKVTASKIGADSNISKDTTLTVDNYSKTIAYAVADSDFAGGTSKTVRAVAKSDQDKLITQAQDKIKQQTQDSLSNSDPNTATLALNDLQFTKKQFDHNVGEEASTVTLDMTGSLDVLVYSKADLFKLAQSQLQSQLPPGTVLTTEGTQINVNNPVKTDGSYKANVVVQANLMPDFDSNHWAGQIKGKSIAGAKNMLQTIEGFQSATARTSPPIPFISKNYLPLKNIEIQLVTQ